MFAVSSGTPDATLTNNASVVSTVVGAPGPLVGSLEGDADNDGMSDAWEVSVGLDPASDQRGQDPDGDGRTNAQEYAAGTHPRGFHQRHFAEGVSSATFRTRFALFVPQAGAAAHVQVRMVTAAGQTVRLMKTVSALRPVTVDAIEVFGAAAAEFATTIESDEPIVVERTTEWDRGRYGSHTDAGVARPEVRWYFAEGSTRAGFQLFYAVANPTSTPTTVRITFLREAPERPLSRLYTVPANSRVTIWANQIAEMADASTGAIVESIDGVPILAERSMYRNSAGVAWGAGHAGSGAAAPATAWELAEGASGSFFDTFLLLANPTASAAAVEVDYRREDGVVVRRNYTITGMSRLTVWVDNEGPDLASTSFSIGATSTNGVPIVVERVMGWPGAAGEWRETHLSTGATVAGPRWALAEGEVGRDADTDTFVLVSNPSALDTAVAVSAWFEDGSAARQVVRLPAHSRATLELRSLLPASIGRRFGITVESLDGQPLVVERASYGSAGGVRWASGAATLATLLP